ncbi:MAG: HAMP domain-containing histidine kinase [Candidatus Sabulitectum sp.]|nr:HAMP domain-containing histidine kinase [Candidatus Sabulitectum sp.]
MKHEPWELVKKVQRILQQAGQECVCDAGMMGELTKITDELEYALSGNEPTAGEVLRILGHELKSPIAAIVSLLHAVEIGYVKNPENSMRMIGRARKRAEELLPLVTDIMVLGNLTGADASHLDERVSMLAICRSVHELMELMFKEKGISFEFSYPEDEPFLAVRGRETFLRRVIQNLCVNAFKYNRAGGCIYLRVFAEDSTVVVEVEDTGMGIPAEDLPHVFAFLFRGSQAKRNPDGGLGLGLSMVKQIVEVHGGTITAESEEGKGTIMTVRLPICTSCE